MKLRTTIVSLTSMALLCSVGLLPAQAAKHHVNPNVNNTANIGVTGTVVGDCTISQGAYAVTFNYDPVTGGATETGSPAQISYTCTNNAAVGYEVQSPQGVQPAWNAVNGGNNLAYTLYKGNGQQNSCTNVTEPQLNGTYYPTWNQGTGTGSAQWLSYCANANAGQPLAVEGNYLDTVTLTLTAS